MGFFKSIHPRIILRILGMAFMVVAGLQFFTTIIASYFEEPEGTIFLFCAIGTLIIATLLLILNPLDDHASITIRDSFLIIITLWFFVPFIGMFPFYFGSPIDSFSDALFESYAGFTTTGFTNLEKYELLPKSIIFWKSIIQWLGGMGLMIFIIALFPLVKEGEFKLFFSDLQDVSYKPLHYKISGTARRLWLTYIIFTIIGFVALMFAGQNWFDALCFSMSSVSTGGGILYNGNITHFSLPIKTVLAMLMFVAGANYLFIFQIFKKQRSMQNDEFFSYFRVFFFSTVLIILVQGFKHGFNGTMIFESIFNTVSFVSTTGFYSNQTFDTSILFVWSLLFFLLFVGSSTGSSGGGINIYRMMILIRTLKNYIKTSIHPHSYYQTTFNHKVISPTIITRVYAFFMLYIAIFFVGSLLLSLFGFDVNNAIGLCAASISNTGPGVFLLNGNIDLSQIHDGSKIVIMLLMVVGRIELFPFLIIFSKSFRRV